MIIIKEKSGWKNLPKGWTEESAKKFWRKVNGKVSTCVKRLEGKVDNPEALCASLKDMLVGSTEWRNKEKEENELKSKIDKLKGKGD